MSPPVSSRRPVTTISCARARARSMSDATARRLPSSPFDAEIWCCPTLRWTQDGGTLTFNGRAAVPKRRAARGDSRTRSSSRDAKTPTTRPASAVAGAAIFGSFGRDRGLPRVPRRREPLRSMPRTPSLLATRRLRRGAHCSAGRRRWGRCTASPGDIVCSPRRPSGSARFRRRPLPVEPGPPRADEAPRRRDRRRMDPEPDRTGADDRRRGGGRRRCAGERGRASSTGRTATSRRRVTTWARPRERRRRDARWLVCRGGGDAAERLEL